MKKFYIKSFGCQMNKLDSSLVCNAMKEAGFEQRDVAKESDVVLINTCSVRENAEKKVLSTLGLLKHYKKENPGTIVAILGCMAQRLGESLLEYDEIDLVIGPGQIPQITSMVNEVLEKHTKKAVVAEKIRAKSSERETAELDQFEFDYDSDDNHIAGQAFVRVMRGCNNFCSYCIVPYVRGPEQSRSPEAIIEQIKKLSDSGVKQITLLGQTVNSYKHGKHGLAELMEKVSEIDAIKWIRFITSHPGKFDDNILDAMASLEKVTPYLHIPAQSGSDTILKAMNRGYTSSQYLELIAKAKEKVKGIAIASDFIVGFPSETEADFADTVELARKAQLKNSFVFKYSPRPGTKTADNLADNVPEEVKKQRNNDLLEVQMQISEEYNKQYLGQSVKVLVEGLSKKPHLNRVENDDNPQLIGRTGTDHIVVFNGPTDLSSQFANVRIIKTAPLTLFGKLAKQ